MAVNPKHILQQGPVLKAFGLTVARTLLQQIQKQKPSGPAALPGPETTRTLPPRPNDLVADYIRHVGGDPGSYRGLVPAHLWPQWGFGLASEMMAMAPYPLAKVLNFGCKMELAAPIPAGQPLTVSGRLADIDDNGRRAILDLRVVTATPEVPQALMAHLYAFVPLGGGGDKGAQKKKPRKPRPRVPADARELAFWRLSNRAGLDFAMLTGDFNPVHWVPPYARMAGFKNVILHGFGTMARAIEGLNRNLWSGDVSRLATWDCKFTRPLVLPARVGLYIDGEGGVFVGDAPGGPAYLVGSYTTTDG